MLAQRSATSVLLATILMISASARAADPTEDSFAFNQNYKILTITVDTRPTEPKSTTFNPKSINNLRDALTTYCQTPKNCTPDDIAQIPNTTTPFHSSMLSKHHVVGQQYLQCLYLVHWYTQNGANKDKLGSSADFHDLGAAIKGASADSDQLSPMARFVWMPANLFDGIHSSLRTDDPERRFENHLPMSLNESDHDRVDRLTQLKNRIGNVCVQVANTTHQYSVKIDPPKLYEDLREIATILEKLPRQKYSFPAAFNIADWVPADLSMALVFSNGRIQWDRNRASKEYALQRQ